MKQHGIYSIFSVALLVWSATVFISCNGDEHSQNVNEEETLLTQSGDSLTIITSENGVLQNKFYTIRMERYEFASEPYTEFPKGIYIETYNDTSSMVESSLRSDYAIHWESNDLWEIKGNVLGNNAKGQIIETQQLFWNRRTKKIYSNVDTKITNGEDYAIGMGFESDDNLDRPILYRSQGRMPVDTQTGGGDSTTVNQKPIAEPVTKPITKPVAEPKEHIIIKPPESGLFRQPGSGGLKIERANESKVPPVKK